MSIPINTICLYKTVCVYLVGCICSNKKRKPHTYIPSENLAQDKHQSGIIDTGRFSCLKAITSYLIWLKYGQEICVVEC